MMRVVISSLLIAVVLATYAIGETSSMPTDKNRVKRMSDHRVAELQTLLSMGKMGGKVVTHKIGYGQVDPMKIGRRRRSDPRMLSRLQQLLLSAAAGDSHEALEEEQQMQQQLEPSSEEQRQILLQLLSDQEQGQGQPRFAWWSRPVAPQM